MQEIAAQLRPEVLDELGLGTALQYEARRFQERTGIGCEVRLPESQPALSPAISIALFRIFQECLTNVARHAQAAKVEAELKLADDLVALSVQDNGGGISEADLASPKALGLVGMKERAALLGGEMLFQRAPEGGTIVTVRIPRSASAPQTVEDR